jgi:hypothetical protein
MSRTFPQYDKNPAMRDWLLTYKDKHSEYYQLEIDGYMLRVWGASTPDAGKVYSSWHWSISHASLDHVLCSKNDLSLPEARDEALMTLKQLRKT